MSLFQALLFRPILLALVGFWPCVAFPKMLPLGLGCGLALALAGLGEARRTGGYPLQALALVVGVILAWVCLPWALERRTRPDLTGALVGEGVILGDAEVRRDGWPAAEVALKRLEGRGWSTTGKGRIRLTLQGPGDFPPPWSLVRFEGRGGEGGMFRARRLWTIESAPWWEVLRWQLRQGLRSTLQRIGGRGGPLALALLLGSGEEFTPQERDLIRAAGAAPLLALSGLHLGVLASLVGWILRRVVGRGIADGVTALVLAGFVILVGPLPSLLRALVFWLVTRAAFSQRWPLDGAEATALGAWILLVLKPEWCHSWALALSVGAVLGLILLAPQWEAALRPCFGAKWASMAAVGLAASAATGPLSLLGFGAFYPHAVLTNWIGSLPIMVFLYAGVAYLLLGGPAPLGWALEVLGEALFRILEGFSALPAARGLGGWLVWGVFLAPQVQVMYRYAVYAARLRFPRRPQELPATSRPGGPKTMGAELPHRRSCSSPPLGSP